MRRTCLSFRTLLIFIATGVILVGNFLPNTLIAQEKPEQQAIETTGAAQQQLQDFVYSPMGRRDPFSPLVQQVKKVKGKPKRELGPLEKFELSQFRLMAILIVKGSPRAMVRAPDGKSYTVKLADPIGKNEGIVTKIETKVVAIDPSGQRIEKSPDRIVVEEPGIDNYTGKVVKDYSYIVM